MKHYRFWAKTTYYSYLDVDAESDDEAWEIAEGRDGGEFIPTERDGDFEIYTWEALEPAENTKYWAPSDLKSVAVGEPNFDTDIFDLDNWF